ncbi:MAG: T9SS type A sorting domain-containing protein [Bacteroidetes bacterium]|nr:T9SS type A sorting domain-containing protein [Bacteroidota bacterium]
MLRFLLLAIVISKFSFSIRAHHLACGTETSLYDSFEPADEFNSTQCDPDDTTQVVNACGSFTWIDGVTYTESTETPFVTLQNIGGCDSVVHLNLTISTLDVLISGFEESLSAFPSGANYQWMNCDSNYSPVAGETAFTFTPEFSGNYACEVSLGGCTDTTECVFVLIESIADLSNNSIRAFFTGSDLISIVSEGFPNTNVYVYLFSLDGKLIKQESIFLTGTNLIESPEIQGVYLIQINSENEVLLRKSIFVNSN